MPGLFLRIEGCDGILVCMQQTNLSTLLESILFVSDRPISLKKLSLLMGAPLSDIRECVAFLLERYHPDRSGIVLVQHGDSLLLTTHPDASEMVAGLLSEERSGELTRASLETLAVISYRGPVAKSAIEEIRGVNCTLALRNLSIRGLIETKNDTSGQPLYAISFDFLKSLGIQKTSQLPQYDTLHSEMNGAPV